MAMEPELVLIAKATAVLALFSWLCGTVTTYVRGKTMQSPNGEDGGVMNFFNRVFFVPTGSLSEIAGNEENDKQVNRWIRIGNNNTANIPISIVVFWSAAMCKSLSFEFLQYLVWGFVVFRLLHTITYALSMQPFRTISYSAGCMCMFIAAGSLLFSF